MTFIRPLWKTARSHYEFLTDRDVGPVFSMPYTRRTIAVMRFNHVIPDQLTRREVVMFRSMVRSAACSAALLPMAGLMCAASGALKRESLFGCDAEWVNGYRTAGRVISATSFFLRQKYPSVKKMQAEKHKLVRPGPAHVSGAALPDWTGCCVQNASARQPPFCGHGGTPFLIMP